MTIFIDCWDRWRSHVNRFLVWVLSRSYILSRSPEHCSTLFSQNVWHVRSQTDVSLWSSSASWSNFHGRNPIHTKCALICARIKCDVPITMSNSSVLCLPWEFRARQSIPSTTNSTTREQSDIKMTKSNWFTTISIRLVLDNKKGTRFAGINYCLHLY